jgi:hypothetical protein
VVQMTPRARLVTTRELPPSRACWASAGQAGRAREPRESSQPRCHAVGPHVLRTHIDMCRRLRSAGVALPNVRRCGVQRAKTDKPKSWNR